MVFSFIDSDNKRLRRLSSNLYTKNRFITGCKRLNHFPGFSFPQCSTLLIMMRVEIGFYERHENPLSPDYPYCLHCAQLLAIRAIHWKATIPHHLLVEIVPEYYSSCGLLQVVLSFKQFFARNVYKGLCDDD